MSKMWSERWSERWRLMGRTPGTPARDARANTLGIFAAALILATSVSLAFALSESPAAGSSPAASAAPAPSNAAPAMPPATKLVPSDETEPPAETGPPAAPSEAGAAGATGTTTKKPRKHHKAAGPPEVEPATARLRVIHDGWIYAGPSTTSKKIEHAVIGKYVDVTGSTKYYLQVKLKNGETGYIAPSDVALVKPIDKLFVLTQDAAVLEAPNRWSKKLAEVHRTHSVHAIGLALNYMQIRMKSGLTGFIPLTALQ